VAADRDHGRERFERSKYFRFAHIAGVNDQFRPAQRIERFPAQQPVRVGNEPQLQGSSTIGARWNAIFFPFGSMTLTCATYCPGVSFASGTWNWIGSTFGRDVAVWSSFTGSVSNAFTRPLKKLTEATRFGFFSTGSTIGS